MSLARDLVGFIRRLRRRPGGLDPFARDALADVTAALAATPLPSPTADQLGWERIVLLAA